MCKYNFFQQKVVLLVIYLSNHGSSKSTIFMLIMAFDVLLTSFLSNQLELFVSCNIKLFALCFDVYFFGIPKKWDPGHGTRDPGPIRGTGTRVPPPGTFHLGHGTLDLYAGPGTRDLYVGPGT